MEAIRFSETSAGFHRTTWHYIPEDRTLQNISWFEASGPIEPNEVFWGYQPCLYEVSIQQKIGLLNTPVLTGKEISKTLEIYSTLIAQVDFDAEHFRLNSYFRFHIHVVTFPFITGFFLHCQFLETRKFHVKTRFRLIQVLLWRAVGLYCTNALLDSPGSVWG
jgi:hypothetical protein